jgi:hypothetical protein
MSARHWKIIAVRATLLLQQVTQQETAQLFVLPLFAFSEEAMAQLLLLLLASNL